MFVSVTSRSAAPSPPPPIGVIVADPFGATVTPSTIDTDTDASSNEAMLAAPAGDADPSTRAHPSSSAAIFLIRRAVYRVRGLLRCELRRTSPAEGRPVHRDREQRQARRRAE